ncbi:MAG: endolytic transglycosylase MltG, partial [Anaerolineaceae bacterium]|nr:endolytic transglycosylase MltG [Anaerolineaceae bacterium]
MAGERSERISRILTLTLLALLLALTISILMVMNALPRLAAREFGAASLSINAVQRLNYSVQLFLNRSDLLLPLDAGGVPHPFRIEANESINSIVARLEREGIIRDAAAIRIYLIYSGGDTQIQAGEFQLNPAMNAVEIAEVLKDASLTHGKLRILAGWRLEEIAASLPTSGFQITEEEFLRLAANPAAFRLPQGVNGVSSLEGFHYPDDYVLDRAIGAEEF